MRVAVMTQSRRFHWHWIDRHMAHPPKKPCTVYHHRQHPRNTQRKKVIASDPCPPVCCSRRTANRKWSRRRSEDLSNTLTLVPYKVHAQQFYIKNWNSNNTRKLKRRREQNRYGDASIYLLTERSMCRLHGKKGANVRNCKSLGPSVAQDVKKNFFFLESPGQIPGIFKKEEASFTSAAQLSRRINTR